MKTSSTALLSALFFSLAPAAPARNAGEVPVVASHVATANGVKLHYLEAGQGPDTPVVLLHGYAETSRMWVPLMPRLAATRTVIAPELRGAGGSSRPVSGYDKRTLAQDIHAMVAPLGFKRSRSWVTTSASWSRTPMRPSTRTRSKASH